MDKLIKREDFYQDLNLKYKQVHKMYEEERNRRIELEKLVAAYEKDLEDRMQREILERMDSG